jgi:drug/metabolite transporter (DMT)-like permease
MPATAVLLALAAAALHAGWNVLIAGARDSEAAMAVMLLVSIVVFAPVAALTWDVSWDAVPFIAASSVLELAYFALLGRAYRSAELSVVYPLARGVAPVLVLVFSVALLAAATSPGQVAGVLLVGAGVLLVRGIRRGRDVRGVGLALVIGCCIAGYTLVDKEGIAHAGPITYLELVSIGPTAAYVAVIASVRGRAPLRAALNARTVLAGLGLFGAYALVLGALRLAPAAPVAAIRESSVLIATVLATVLLHERVGRERFLGAALVVAGVILVSAS